MQQILHMFIKWSSLQTALVNLRENVFMRSVPGACTLNPCGIHSRSKPCQQIFYFVEVNDTEKPTILHTVVFITAVKKFFLLLGPMP
jgi:hypothetical protein